MPIEPQPCGAGNGAGDAVDVEQALLCDVLPDGTIVGSALAVYQYDATGAPIGAPTFVDPVTGLPYVAQGTLMPCPGTEASVSEFLLCDVQPDSASVQFIRKLTQDSSGAVLQVDNLTLDGVPYTPTGTVSDCDPYTLCTPEPNVDLNADCGPGEPINIDIPADAGDSPNHVINDDPTADPLCGGTWNRPEEAQEAPFPVLESFRNSTLDQLPANTGGSPPYLQLTSGGVDPVGAGWARMSDINSTTNGFWQVGTPFPSANGITSEITFAMHDGTTPGGDGLTFTLTDGSAPAQVAAVGGGGSLGNPSWAGGYLSVNFDEYGGTGFDTGMGFAPNSITITRAGAGYGTPGSGIARASVAPHQLNSVTRANPARLRVSVIVQGGVPLVSAAVDWNDGNGFVQYFDRLDASAAGPVPATMRMGINGASGGSFRDVKEARDAEANAIGIQEWRAFPITTDAIPACVTLVSISASVDVTFASSGGDNTDPDAYFYLVNTATNTILASDRVSALSAQLGSPQTLEVSADVSPADIPNLRLYVGQDTRDDSGAYGATWDNLTIDASGAGCPTVPIRTMAISAPCPLPVTIVGGGTGDDGGGGGTTIFNAPSTFEDAPVCLDGVPGFRREVRDAAGNIVIQFLTTGGVPVDPPPANWTPGACPSGDTELLEICDLGTDPPTPFVRRATYDGNGAVVSAEDTDYLGNPYVPAGVVGRCDTCTPLVLGPVCVVSTDFPGQTLPAIAVQACDGTVSYLNQGTGDPWPNSGGPVICPPDNTATEEILCDDGNGNQPFRRVYVLTPLGSTIAYDEDLDGNPYVVVGDAVQCGSTPGRDVEQIVLCDDNGPFLRAFQYGDDTGTPTGTPDDYTLTGAPYVPIGTVGVCNEPQFAGFVCDIIGATPATPDETFTDNFSTATAAGGGTVYTWPDFGGSGLLVSVFPELPSPLVGTGIQLGDINQAIAYQLPAAATDIHLVATNFSLANGDQMGFSPDPPIAVTGQGAITAFVVDPTASPGVADVTVGPSPTFNLSTPGSNGGGGIIQTQITFTIPGAAASDGTVVPLKQFHQITGGVHTVTYTTLDGTPYTPVGTVGACPTRDTEVLALCDDGPATPVQFLRRLTFDETGALFSIVDTDLGGAAYVVTGDAVLCGVETPGRDVEQAVLCDNNGPFLRVYQYGDDTGTPSGVPTDYTLAGAPYVPVGTVVDCSTAQTPEALALCDITQEPSLDGVRSALNLTTLPVGPTAGSFPNGIGYTVDQGLAGGSGTYLITTGTTQNWTFSEPSMLRFGVNNLNIGAECVTLPVGTVVESIHANHTYNPLTRVLCNGGAALGGDESIFTLDAATTLAITSNPGGGGQRGLVRLEAAPTVFTEVRTPFLRTICRTCGEAPVVTDTAMDAVTPYVPAGTVGVCATSSAPETCSNSNTLLVCDTPITGVTTEPSTTDTNPVPYQTIPGEFPVTGGAAVLWSGGTLNIPPDVAAPPDAATQYVRTAAGILQAPRPCCDDGTVDITITMRVVRTGPQPACAQPGNVSLRNGITPVAAQSLPLDTPVGTVTLISLSATVPAADLAAGNIAVVTRLETWQNSAACGGIRSGGWTLNQYDAQASFDIADCATQFLRTVTVDCTTGAVTATTDTTLDGAPYVPVCEVGQCLSSGGTTPAACCSTPNTVQLCDDNDGTPFLRTLVLDAANTVVDIIDTDLDGALYTVVGSPVVCEAGAGRDVEQIVLCDNNGPFLRVYQYGDDTGTPSGAPANYTLAGAPYVPVGPVIVCPSTAGRDEELLVLCDATPTRFLRRYNYDSTTGALLSIVNTTLDGSTAFVPVGAVGVCTTAIASDFDFLSTVLCDANGTQFIQRLTFNSATGAVTATTNTTLTGAAFAPVGAVALCSSCCPVVMGEGCTNVGSLRYTALRLSTGAISLIDSVTGAAVPPANIVACAPANGVLPNVAADHFEALPGTPWTPAAIPGGRRLVSLTYSVITGTATVVDATGGTSIATIPAGYSATWTAQDDRETLTPPASITSVGGRVIVLMLTAA